MDKDRRQFVERLIKTTAFAVPLALGLDAITATNALANSDASSATGGGTAPASSTSPILQNSSTVSVPEASTLALTSLGIAAIALSKRAKKEKTDS